MAKIARGKVDRFKKQAVWRYGEASLLTLARKERSQVLHRQFVSAYFQKRARKEAHHTPQKAVSHHTKKYLVGCLAPDCISNSTIKCFYLRITLGEGGKIGILKKHLCSLL